MKTWLTLIALLSFTLTETSEARSFKTERWQTANGAQVVFYQAMEVPMLDINVAFAAGSAYDGQHFGLSALTTELLAEGSANLDATQVAENFADIGAQYNSETSRDMVVLQLKTLTSNEALSQAIDTLSLIINKPAFRQEAFNREKNQQLVAINQLQESPSDVANIIFFNKLYQNHPYAHPVKGTLDSVNSIRLSHVQNFYKQYFVGRNAVIVMVGAIDSDKAHQLADQLTQHLPVGHEAPPISKAPPLTAKETVTVNYPSSQTMLRIGQVGIDHHAADYFPLIVGNYILGGGSLVSKLSLEVREKRGLTYGVVSQFMPMPGDGPFLISLSTQNNQAGTALKTTEKVLKNFLAKGPSDGELTAAKQYLTGSFPLSLASNGSIAGMLLRIAFYHLPDDYLDTYTARIESVTIAEIKKAFDNAIHPDQMLFVSVGKLEKAKP
jgi:zinc protease